VAGASSGDPRNHRCGPRWVENETWELGGLWTRSYAAAARDYLAARVRETETFAAVGEFASWRAARRGPATPCAGKERRHATHITIRIIPGTGTRPE